MNDEQRAALVAALQETIREAFGYGTVPMEYNSGQMAESFVEQHIDRLLADEFQKGYSQRLADEKKYSDRAVPTAEPDAEATVERAISVYNEAVQVGLPDHIDPHRYAMQEALIAAMPSCADAADGPWLGPPDKGVTVMATVVEAEDVPMFPDLAADDDSSWLDDALDSAWPGSGPAEIYLMVRGDIADRWGVWIRSCYTNKREDADHPLYHVSHGTGTTRREAILDACAKAKEATNG